MRLTNPSFDLGRMPFVWTETERKKGRAWSLEAVETFYTRGTSSVE